MIISHDSILQLFNGSSPLPNVTCIIIFTVYAGSDYPIDSSIEPLMLRGPQA